MPQLLTQNSKLKKTSKENGLKVFNFGIPAYKSVTGKKTCPFADSCVAFCYAKKGAYIWSNVKPAFEYRYKITLQDNFPELMIKEIKRKKADIIRIHDSGDFYSPAYLNKWYKIMQALPHVHFYAYTNSMPFFRPMKKVNGQWQITGPDYKRPDNFTLIYSTGGKFAHLRKDTDRKTHIFNNAADLKAMGYIDASKNDLNAIDPDNKNVGLIYH